MMSGQMLITAGANKKSTDTDDSIPFDRICGDIDAKCSEETRAALAELLRV